jgi:GDP-4-dehydro-6-deoxy-D-mannose reductase
VREITMERALIIGAAGFVGGYLIDYLAQIGVDEIHATKLPNSELTNDKAVIHELDILDKESVVSLLYEIRPTHIFHLAAQSSVGVAWKNPGLTIDVNIKGSVNVLDAVRELFYKPRILMIGSGEEYGHVREGEVPISEDNHIRPGNIYAATKACQNMIGSIYARGYDMELVQVRAFNHIGPGQASLFVVSDFCKQVAEIEKGLREPIINVGNLKAKRDFTDVRDVVRAYYLLALNGEAGETYNVGSGHAVPISDILDKIIKRSSKEISVVIDANKIRPVDVPIIEADISKINTRTGWHPEISIDTTIEDTLEYWRKRV